MDKGMLKGVLMTAIGVAGGVVLATLIQKQMAKKASASSDEG